MRERLFLALQHGLPKHGLSRLIGHLAASSKRWIRRPFIRLFSKAYGIDLSEATATDPDAYQTFNQFFTRALRPGARPIDQAANSIVSPADGQISEFGRIEAGQLVQAKGIRYSLQELTGCNDVAAYEGGSFATIYLAPRDYHRVHVPLAGALTRTTAIPGELFSVNGATARGLRNLFARNERLVCHFDTAAGDMLVILVGALIVASIDTVWDGPESPYRDRQQQAFSEPLAFAKGDEMGRFLLGSTVILCFPRGPAHWLDDLQQGQDVRMGEAIGQLGRDMQPG